MLDCLPEHIMENIISQLGRRSLISLVCCSKHFLQYKKYVVDIVQISGGYYNMIILTSTGKVIASGDNTYGRIDMFDDINEKIMQIGNGIDYTAALTVDGILFISGTGMWTMSSDVINKRFSSISCKNDYIVAITTTGTVIVIGNNVYNVGNVPKDISDVHRKFYSSNTGKVGSDFVIAVGGNAVSALALTSNGKVIIWGDRVHGKYEIPNFSYSENESWKIGGNNNHLVVLSSTGKLLGLTFDSISGMYTADFSNDVNITSVSCEFDKTYVLTSDGIIYDFIHSRGTGTLFINNFRRVKLDINEKILYLLTLTNHTQAITCTGKLISLYHRQYIRNDYTEKFMDW